MKPAAISFASLVFPLTLLLAGVVAAQSAPPRKDIPAIAKAANGAIVTITMANNDKPIAQGTGFLVSADGVIVTNYHVIETGNVAVVKFPDGTAFPVDGVLAGDKVRDLAIIKIHGKTFRTLTLGNSDRVQVGEEVVAIGNPLSLESTVSNGIISGVRTPREQGGKFLQTTAPITNGSSGGPLFNMIGEVIGITTQGYEGAGNLNSAIPINEAKLLLLNQSAKLQNLPNEVPAPEPTSGNSETRHASLAEQKACSEQVKLLPESVEFITQKNVFETRFASHYDPTSGVCYMISTRPRSRPKPDYLWWIYFHNIQDAFEGHIVGSFSETFTYADCNNSSSTCTPTGQQQAGRSCSIYPPGQQNITCKSEDEFNALALKYFGITPL